MRPYTDFSGTLPSYLNSSEVAEENALRLRKSIDKYGSLTNTVQPGQGRMLPNAIANMRDKSNTAYSQASELMKQPIDYTGLQDFARQRGQQGEQAMLNALAAQYAGENFAPLQQQFMKTAAGAQEPIKVGGGLITARGGFVKDPEAAQEKQIQRLMSDARFYEQLAANAQSQEEKREQLALQNESKEAFRQLQLSQMAGQNEATNRLREIGLGIQAGNAATNRMLAEATINQKGQPQKLPFSAIENLTKQASLAETMTSIAQTFKPSYGSPLPGVPGVGAALNFTGRSGYGDQARANWWQNYNEQANIIRNQLFGSALTLTEKAAFEAAMISPDMAADVIQTRLMQQAAAAQRAYTKIVEATGASGYNVTGLPGLSAPVKSAPPGGGSKDLNEAEMAELERLRAKHRLGGGR